MEAKFDEKTCDFQLLLSPEETAGPSGGLLLRAITPDGVFTLMCVDRGGGLPLLEVNDLPDLNPPQFIVYLHPDALSGLRSRGYYGTRYGMSSKIGIFIGKSWEEAASKQS